MAIAPCKKAGVDCPKRAVGCHDTCPEYLDFLEQKRAESEIIHKSRRAEDDYVASKVKFIDRVKKQKGYKKR